MSFQELGSLGEFIAAVATVTTLVYLALQVRMNNRLAVSNIENQLNSRECERRPFEKLGIKYIKNEE